MLIGNTWKGKTMSFSMKCWPLVRKRELGISWVFRHGWNKEIIAQFYATIFFGYYDEERAMFWMIEEQKYHITFSDFVLYSALVLLILIFPSCMMRVSWR